MKTWFLDEPKQLRLENAEPTKLNEELNVKVKIERVLFSISDYNVYSGESCVPCYPFIMGRNAVGVISDIYPQNKTFFKKMDRVVFDVYEPCGTCDECAHNNFIKCNEMTELGRNTNGFLQTFVDISKDRLHKLPANVSDEDALFVPYVAKCLNVINSLEVEKGRHVVIFANTKLGIILAQIVAYYQAIPVIVTSNNNMIRLARENGIFYCFNINECDLQKAILNITGGRMSKSIVFLADSEFELDSVYEICSYNATICMVDTSNHESTISVAEICRKSLGIVCVNNGYGQTSSAINLISMGVVKTANLLGKNIDFEKLEKELANVNRDELLLKSLVVKFD